MRRASCRPTPGVPPGQTHQLVDLFRLVCTRPPTPCDCGALQAGTVFKGKIIVSTKNREIAYVAVEGLEIDAIIMGLENQNRAVRCFHPAAVWARWRRVP